MRINVSVDLHIAQQWHPCIGSQWIKRKHDADKANLVDAQHRKALLYSTKVIRSKDSYTD